MSLACNYKPIILMHVNIAPFSVKSKAKQDISACFEQRHIILSHFTCTVNSDLVWPSCLEGRLLVSLPERSLWLWIIIVCAKRITRVGDSDGLYCSLTLRHINTCSSSCPFTQGHMYLENLGVIQSRSHMCEIRWAPALIHQRWPELYFSPGSV